MVGQNPLRIKLTAVFVNDQARALKFYTEILGFEKKQDITAGKYRWLTVVSPEERDGTQLHLEPNDNPAAKEYQEAIFKQGIPALMKDAPWASFLEPAFSQRPPLSHPWI